MKGMPLPFDFEGKGVLDLDFLVNNRHFFTDSTSYLKNNNPEPTSVLDSPQISSRPTSSSTLSSSHGGAGSSGGGASTDTAPKWHQDSTTATSTNAARPDSQLLPVPPSLEIVTGNPEKFAMEDWESVLSESAAVSPTQEQTFLRWIMGDVEDPAMGNLNKVLQVGAAADFDSGAGFGVVDQGFAGDHRFASSFMPSFPNNRSSSEKLGLVSISNPIPSNSPPNFLQNNNLSPLAFDSSAEMKPPIFNPHFLINQHQTQHTQNPSFLFPGPEAGPGIQISKAGPYMDTGQQQEAFMARQQLQQQGLPHQLQLLPHCLQQRPLGPQKHKMEELGQFQQQQQVILDQLFKAAELVQTGNPALAQGILARLNHQLSPIGKPFHRAAFYFKEALQLLLHNNCNTTPSSPFTLVFKIGAYKSLSEISPLVQFSNFTCNQAVLEALEGFDRIHIVDFDIGYGGQWASLMQELALRSGGAPSLKITALASNSTHDQLDLGLTRDNLVQFATEIGIAFEFEAISIDSLNSTSWSMPFHAAENEGIAVNLPVGSLAIYQSTSPLILRLVKQLSPRIVVSVDRGCDRTDLPFANHIVHALQSYSNLLESLDAVNVNMDALQKIERFLLQPGIEKIVMSRARAPERTQHWRALFLSSGFSPITFSNFTESQAECVVKRTPVRGFQVEKRQSSLVLCWQRKELISASAWRC